MQLYEVWFQYHFANFIDIGRVLVCAQDQVSAKEIVIAAIDLPASALTQCDAKRLKPNLFILERKEIAKPQVNACPEASDKPASQKGLRVIANALAENREYRREMTEYVAQQRWAMETCGKSDDVDFECRILATINADSEERALQYLAGALRMRAECGGINTGRHVKKVWVDLKPDYVRAAVRK